MEFVRQVQVATAAWLPPASRTAAIIAAARLLQCLPVILDQQERCVMANALARVAAHLADPAPQNPSWALPDYRDPIARVIEMAGKSDVSLQCVARRLNCSRWHLSRTIRRRTGLTFRLLVNTSRLFRAISLLVTSVASIKEIAAMTGYRTTNALDRQFKRYLRISPTAFRRSLDARAVGLAS